MNNIPALRNVIHGYVCTVHYTPPPLLTSRLAPLLGSPAITNLYIIFDKNVSKYIIDFILLNNIQGFHKV